MAKQEGNSALNKLSDTLMGIENDLLKRKIDRQEATIDSAMDILNTAAEMGAIEFRGCEDGEDDCEDEKDGEDSGENNEDDVADGEGDSSNDE